MNDLGKSHHWIKPGTSRSRCIFSACRVYFKYFLTKMNVCMCSGMLSDPNALRCDIWSFYSESLMIEKTNIGIVYQISVKIKQSIYVLIRW